MAAGGEAPMMRRRRESTSQGKREKFRRLAENRTNNALAAIGRIGNLSNRQLYEFEEAEVRKIIKALKDAVGEVETPALPSTVHIGQAAPVV